MLTPTGTRSGSPPSIVEEGSEYPRSARVLQLAKRLGLDLADALASDRERVAYFLQRMVAGHSEAEPHANNALLAGGEGCQDFGDRIAQARLDHRIDRLDRIFIFNKVAKAGILLIPHWGLC